ncbi:MAG: pyridoxamine 5'-phosphate oxidase family protein [Sporichthyaceae bacterium]
MTRVRNLDHSIPLDSPALAAFWSERHPCTLTTLHADGRPHVVPVGATFDPEVGLVRVIASRPSLKVRQVAAAGPAGAHVAICQVDGGRWATAEGLATVSQDPDDVREAERRYALRYREPKPNPERVVILVKLTRMLGHVPS